MMLFGCACCNSHGKGRFSLSRYVELVKKQGKVGSQKEMFLLFCMTDFPRVKEKKMVTVWDCARMYGVANVRSYQVTKDCHMQKFAKEAVPVY